MSMSPQTGKVASKTSRKGEQKASAAKKPSKKAASPRTSSKVSDDDLGFLRRAEAVLVNGLEVAVALAYSPGSTPVVLCAEQGRRAERIVWAAQTLSLPILEIVQLDAEQLPLFEPGREIHESWYRIAAHALSMLYKSTPVPELVRFVRLVDGRGRPRSFATGAVEFEDVLGTPPVSVELGADLSQHVAELNETMEHMRQRVALETGLVLPPIPLKATAALESQRYVIKFRDVPLLEGEIDLPIDTPERLYALQNRLKQLLHRHGWELLGYLEVETHLERVRKENAGLVQALFPAQFSVSGLRQVLRNLLREQLSIRDLAPILEVILENLPRSTDPDLLTECVRIAYSRSLYQKFRDDEGYLNAIVFDSTVERTLLDAVTDTGGVRWMDLPPDDALRVLQALETALKQVSRLNITPVVLSSPALRRFVARLVEDVFPDLAVLSYSEIAPLTEVRSVGTIRY